MNCESNLCGQQSDKCPTPWKCGAPTSRLANASIGQLIAMDGGNVIDTDSDLEMVGSFGMGTGLAALGIVALIVAAVWIGAYFGEHWAMLVAYMT